MRARWEKLNRKSASLRRSFATLQQELAATAADGADAISGAEIVAAELAKWELLLLQSGPPVRDLLFKLGTAADQDKDSLFQRLIRELRGRGHEIFGSESLIVIDGIVHAKLESSDFKLTVNEKTVAERDVAELTDSIERELQQLEKQLTAPELMLEQMLEAYELALRQISAQPGEPVEATALLWQLMLLRQSRSFRSDPQTPKFRQYPSHVFRADVHRLLASERREVRGRRFRYASGSNTKGAIFLLDPQLGRTAYVGRVWFEHVAQ